MEAAHILVIGDNAWICTGKRGEHNKRTPARVTQIHDSLTLIHTPSLTPGDVVSIENGSRIGLLSREIVRLPVSGRVGALILT